MSEHDGSDLDRVLEQAARAYAAQRHGRSDRAAETRSRIAASARRERQQSLLLMAATVLLALGVGLPAAWAWTTGRLDAWLGVDGGDEAPYQGVPSEGGPRRDRSAELAPPVTAEPAPVPPPAESSAPVLAPEARTEVDPTAPGPVVHQPEAATASMERARTREVTRSAERDDEPEETLPDVDPAERRAYRAAHALHFDQRDAGGALTAWEGYLAQYPNGRFAIEARYNRALCLVRLGRHDQAREALAPFASGIHGEYRRREANALIEAMAR